MKQGGLVGPRHPREEGLGHPELKGRQQLEDWPTELDERWEDLRQAKQGRRRHLKCPNP